MATRLLQIVAFPVVAPAASVPLPHNINIDGTAKIPDFVVADAPGFTIAVTATTVTVTNNSSSPSAVNVWLELKHTIPRQLGALLNLTPQPFIASSGGPGGVVHDATLFGAGTILSPLTRRAGRIVRVYNDFIADVPGSIITDISGSAIFTPSEAVGPGPSQLDSWAVCELETLANNDNIGARLTLEHPGYLGRPNTQWLYEARASYTGFPAGLTSDMVDNGISIGPEGNETAGTVNDGFFFLAGQNAWTGFAPGNNNWWACLNPNTPGFQIDTGVPVAGGNVFQTFRIEGEADGAGNVTARYFIDDVLVATHTPGLWEKFIHVHVAKLVRYAAFGNQPRSVLVDFTDLVVDMNRTAG